MYRYLYLCTLVCIYSLFGRIGDWALFQAEDMFLVFLAIYDSWIAPFTASTSHWSCQQRQ